MKTTDSVMREKWKIEYDKLIHDVVDYPAAFRKVDGFKCTPNEMKDFISHSLAEARREWVEEMRGKANLIEVRSEARYLTDSGFWATKKLVAKDDVLDLLTGDNPERKCDCGHPISEHSPFGTWKELQHAGFPHKCGDQYSCDHCAEEETT